METQLEVAYAMIKLFGEDKAIKITEEIIKQPSHIPIKDRFEFAVEMASHSCN